MLSPWRAIVSISVPSSSDGVCSRTARIAATRIRYQPPQHEPQRLRAGGVEPLDVVEQQQHRLLLGARGHEAERRGGHGEAVLGTPGTQRKGLLQRHGLGGGELAEHRQRRAQQLEQRGEREPGLRLDPAGAQHRHPAGALGGVVEQRGLADSGRAGQRQHDAAGGRGRRECLLDGCLLRPPADKHGLILGSWTSRPQVPAELARASQD